MAKTAKITIFVKDPNGWCELTQKLGLSDDIRRQFFEFAECATIELEFDANLNVVSGRILPLPM